LWADATHPALGAEMWSNGTWTHTGPTSAIERARPTIARLHDGSVLVAGGTDGACGDTLTLRRGTPRLARKDFSVPDGGTVIVRLRLREKFRKRSTAVKFTLTQQHDSISGKLRR
jgi:hypothetical protein